MLSPKFWRDDMSKENFMKAYANLLADERDQIIVLIDGKPYTWNRAYDEIRKGTELGKRILAKLMEFGIISGD